MVVTVAILGLMVMFLGFAVSAYAFYLAENREREGHGFADVYGFADIHFMRWIVRDFGIFLYGCIFACKYIVFGRDTRQPGKLRKHSTRLSPILVVPRQ